MNEVLKPGAVDPPPGAGRTPRVLMVSGNAPPVLDGVGDNTRRLLEELVRQQPDWHWYWLCRRPRWFHSPLVFRHGVTVIRPSHSWSERGTALVCAVARWLKPDVVHVQEQIHSFHETDAACRIAAAVSAPLVTTVHEYHVELPSARFTTELVKRSAVVIANDPRNAERCLQEAGRAAEHLWWSGSSFLPPPADRGIKTVPGRLSTFGFVSELKSIELVADALNLLGERHPALQWRIIGPFDPATNPRHADLARRIGIGWDRAHFTGAVRNEARLTRLLAETEVMLLPFADGASERRSTLQVAWAFGLPVITTPPPTETTAIVDGVNCLLVREPTAAAWASAIERVLTDRDLADRLRAGSRAAADRFSWPRLAALHIEMYERLLKVSGAEREANRD